MDMFHVKSIMIQLELAYSVQVYGRLSAVKDSLIRILYLSMKYAAFKR